jgi:filamentous hemagglutinin family protein
MNSEQIKFSIDLLLLNTLLFQALINFFLNSSAIAQPSNIVPDRTLGNKNSIVIPNLNGDPIEVITGGTQRGQNLFHSFREFNVSEGRGAYFYSPNAAIQNILTRVTGSNPSEIMGTLGTFGNSQPNLFLINPNGIIFGRNASLDVGGSFVATTANGIRLGEKGFFSASEPQTSNLLSIQPSAFFFNALNRQASIVNRSTATIPVLGVFLNGLPSLSEGSTIRGLQVLDGESILFLGGDVKLEAGGRLSAYGGRIELGGLANSGEVGLASSGNILSLQFSSGNILSNVSLSDDAQVGVVGSGGGNIVVNANAFTASNGGRLLAGTEGTGDAGNIVVNANAVRFSGFNTSGQLGSGLYNLTSSGNAGNIFVNANSIELSSGGTISSITFGSGNAGDIKIIASDSIKLTDGNIQTITNEFATGEADAGSIFIKTVNFTTSGVFNTTYLWSGTDDGGRNSGNITLTADSVSFSGGSGIDSSNLGGSGNAGNVTIKTNSLDLKNSTIDTQTNNENGRGGNVAIAANNTISIANSNIVTSAANPGGRGNSGNPNIAANNTVSLANSKIFTNSVGQGNSGNIAIAARSIFSNGNIINSSSSGQGNAGNIAIEANEAIAFDESIILSSDRGGGDSGNISIQSDGFVTLKDSTIASSILRGEKAGDIKIFSNDAVTLDGTTITAFTASPIDGRGGDINISAGSLALINGASLSSFLSEQGQGNAGNINVNVSGSLIASGTSRLSSSSGGKGNAGNITIQAGDTVSFDGLRSDNLISGVFTLIGKDGEVIGRGRGGNITIEARSLSLKNGASFNSSTAGIGDAGNIFIRASDSINLSNSSQLETVTNGQGNAGDVTIEAPNAVVSINGNAGINSSVEQVSGFTGERRGGDITIKARSLSLTNNAQLNALTKGRGNAGNIFIETSDSVSFNNSAIFSSVFNTAIGQGGGITIKARSLSLSNLALLNASTGGRGNGGNILLQASDAINLNNGSLIGTATFGRGNAGNVTINAPNAAVFMQGTAGDRATSINSSVGQISGFTGKRRGGDITIKARSLSLSDRAELSASTFGRGNAGNINLKIKEAATLDRSSTIFSTVESGGIGNAGSVNLSADSLSLTEGSQILTIVRRAFQNPDGTIIPAGRGSGGNVTINAREISFDGTSVDRFGNILSSGVLTNLDIGTTGRGGDIKIKADTLFLSDRAQLATSTSGDGNAGDVSVRVNDSISLTNRSGILSSVAPGGRGKGGNINVRSRSLSLSDGSQLQTILFRSQGRLPGGQGIAGNINVNVTDFINLSGVSPDGFSSGFLASTERGASGTGGNITVKTNDFRVTDGAVVNAFTAASDSNAGRIAIDANTFEATSGGQVITATRSSGNAGRIILNIADRITLSGSDSTFSERLAKFGEDIVNNQGSHSGLFANTAAGSTGKGDSIFIDSKNAIVRDGAGIGVNSEGTGVGGFIRLQADSLTLDRDAFISAQTASNTGGNINLTVSDVLLLRNNSQISTTAGTAGAGGDGGNLDINAKFIIANPIENSDITANAFEGRGGNINLTAQGIFGLESRDNNTNLSDITASSQLGVDGVVQIDTPDTDPSQGIVNLPSQTVDASQLIDQRCLGGSATASEQGEFIMTGRGGIPANPREPLPGEAVLSADWVTLDTEAQSNAKPETPTQSESTSPQPIIEAQGWVIAPNGKIILTAQAPTATPNSPGFAPHSCPVGAFSATRD